MVKKTTKSKKDRCGAITDKGKKCTNPAVDTKYGHRFCRVHSGKGCIDYGRGTK